MIYLLDKQHALKDLKDIRQRFNQQITNQEFNNIEAYLCYRQIMQVTAEIDDIGLRDTIDDIILEEGEVFTLDELKARIIDDPEYFVKYHGTNLYELFNQSGFKYVVKFDNAYQPVDDEYIRYTLNSIIAIFND